MDESFNLTLIVIVNEPIELSDLFNRAKNVLGLNLKLSAPEVRLSEGTGLTLVVGRIPNFIFRGAVSGKDLILFNMNYGNTTRGVFQVQIPNTKDVVVGNETFEALKELVDQLAYTDVFAYEIGINLIVDHTRYPLYNKVKTLKTMKSPRLKAIKLLEEDTQGKDIREECISEISIERMLNQPTKSMINTAYRKSEFEVDALRNILNDIDEVVKLIR